MKDEAYVINLDDTQCKVLHWASLFLDKNTAVYFDSFGIACVFHTLHKQPYFPGPGIS